MTRKELFDRYVADTLDEAARVELDALLASDAAFAGQFERDLIATGLFEKAGGEMRRLGAKDGAAGGSGKEEAQRDPKAGTSRKKKKKRWGKKAGNEAPGAGTEERQGNEKKEAKDEKEGKERKGAEKADKSEAKEPGEKKPAKRPRLLVGDGTELSPVSDQAPKRPTLLMGGEVEGELPPSLAMVIRPREPEPEPEPPPQIEIAQRPPVASTPPAPAQVAPPPPATVAPPPPATVAPPPPATVAPPPPVEVLPPPPPVEVAPPPPVEVLPPPPPVEVAPPPPVEVAPPSRSPALLEVETATPPSPSRIPLRPRLSREKLFDRYVSDTLDDAASEELGNLLAEDSAFAAQFAQDLLGTGLFVQVGDDLQRVDEADPGQGVVADEVAKHEDESEDLPEIVLPEDRSGERVREQEDDHKEGQREVEINTAPHAPEKPPAPSPVATAPLSIAPPRKVKLRPPPAPPARPPRPPRPPAPPAPPARLRPPARLPRPPVGIHLPPAPAVPHRALPYGSQEPHDSYPEYPAQPNPAHPSSYFGEAPARTVLRSARQRSPVAALSLAVILLVCIGFAILLGVAGRPAAQGDDSIIAKVDAAAGTAVLTRGIGQKDLEVGMGIVKGDVIKVLAGSARIAYVSEKTYLHIRSGSEIRVEDHESGKQVRLTLGEVTVEAAPQPTGRPMVVNTSKAKVVLMGKKVTVREVSKETLVEVSAGKVRVERRHDGAKVKLGSGSWTIVSADQPLNAWEFVAGVNLNGDELTVGGNTWLSHTAAQGQGLKVEALGKTPENRRSTEQPAGFVPDAAVRTMLMSSVAAPGTKLALKWPLPSGRYQIFVWIMEDGGNQVRSLRLNVEEKLVEEAIGREQKLGEWNRFGPYSGKVADEVLDLLLSADHKFENRDPHLSGFAVYRIAGTGPPKPDDPLAQPAGGAPFQIVPPEPLDP